MECIVTYLMICVNKLGKFEIKGKLLCIRTYVRGKSSSSCLYSFFSMVWRPDIFNAVLNRVYPVLIFDSVVGVTMSLLYADLINLSGGEEYPFSISFSRFLFLGWLVKYFVIFKKHPSSYLVLSVMNSLFIPQNASLRYLLRLWFRYFPFLWSCSPILGIRVAINTFPPSAFVNSIRSFRGLKYFCLNVC